MPRIAEQEDLERVFPWADWEALLAKSPTKALIFGSEDFGAMSPYAFQKRAKKELHNVTVRVRGEEVLVTINAS